MYCFLNYFAFQSPKITITDKDIFDTLNDLCLFINDLKTNEMTLIINHELAFTNLNGHSLKEYIIRIPDDDKRRILINKITNYAPFCSDVDTSYENDEVIMLENCEERTSKIDIIGNFLSCSLYYNSPIVTPDKLCSKNQFLNDTIYIDCDKSQLNILNFRLNDYKDVLNSYINDIYNTKYSQINTWDEYKEFTNTNFAYIEILNNCLDDLKKYSFRSIQARGIIEDVEKINSFIASNGGNPANVHYKQLSKHINEETADKLRKRKTKLTKKDKDGNSLLMSWHTRIGDFRLYFYFDNSKLYFSFFTAKIPE